MTNTDSAAETIEVLAPRYLEARSAAENSWDDDDASVLGIEDSWAARHALKSRRPKTPGELAALVRVTRYWIEFC